MHSWLETRIDLGTGRLRVKRMPMMEIASITVGSSNPSIPKTNIYIVTKKMLRKRKITTLTSARSVLSTVKRKCVTASMNTVATNQETIPMIMSNTIGI
jgi:hypothetical protein